MVPERSLIGKLAKSVFYHDLNDIDLFIEDKSKGSEKLYTEIFNRAFIGKYRVGKVFSLGNRQTVIEACKGDLDIEGRPRLYIIDGDLELLNGDQPSGIKRLGILSRYCIENYLIDEDAIVQVLFEENLTDSKDEVRAKFGFAEWVKQNQSSLFDLFLDYSLLKKYLPEIPTVSFKVNNLLSSGDGIVDEVKVAKRKQEMEKLLVEYIGLKKYQNQKEQIKKNIKLCWDERLKRFVSGKDYLFPLVLMRMRSITKFRAENKVLKLRITLKCDVNELSELSKQLE